MRRALVTVGFWEGTGILSCSSEKGDASLFQMTTEPVSGHVECLRVLLIEDAYEPEPNALKFQHESRDSTRLIMLQ